MSKITAVSRRASSMAWGLRTKMPRRAESPVETVVTTGMANPRAWGQAITSTVTAKVRANTRGRPAGISQTRKVPSPTVTATTVSQWAARSANRWMGGFAAWASRTNRTIWERVLSSPTRVTRIRRAPSPLTVPPITSAPGRLGTGTDSPVIMASFTELSPSTTSPSDGTCSPGRTRTRSPTAKAEVGTSSIPSAVKRWATDGIRERSSRKAPLVPRTARISSQCPRRSTATKVAISQ